MPLRYGVVNDRPGRSVRRATAVKVPH